MWLPKQLSRVVDSRRGFLRPVSIATHFSSWAVLPTYPFWHTTKLSSSHWPISGFELRRNGHWVDPLGLLLSLQPLWEIEPTWVCFLSVALPSDCLLHCCVCLSPPSRDIQVHMLHFSQATAFAVSLSCNTFSALWVCCVCLTFEPHVGCCQINEMKRVRERTS